MRRTVLIVLSVVFLAGCTGIVRPLPMETPPAPLPPLPHVDSPLPTPAPLTGASQAPEATRVVEAIPTQDPGLASIVGSIVMEGMPPGQFPPTLFLGDPTGSEPLGAMVALDINSAPRGYVRPDGTFVFPNVRPGTYVIIAWTPAGAHLVNNPNTGYTWIIELQDAVRFDAGHLVVPAMNAS